MHQRAITLEQFADIFERMDVFGQIDTGGHLTTVGRHPEIGCVTAIQDAAPGIVVMSELPLSL